MATATLTSPETASSSEKKTARYYTPEEYLELEEKSEWKNEYRDGRITPLGNPNGDPSVMAGASRNHSLVTTSVIASLYTQLRERDCRVYSSDTRVYAPNGGIYTYPDISVVCGEEEFQGEMLMNPTLIVEVLSESTEAYDRGDKFRRYQTVESLMDYLLISQNRPRIEHYSRQGDNRWLLTSADGLEASLAIPSLDITLNLAEIFARVEFPAPVETTPEASEEEAV
ncbi:MAG: Uma2 family endonuclease [Armatimonadaceae bacterium]